MSVREGVGGTCRAGKHMVPTEGALTKRCLSCWASNRVRLESLHLHRTLQHPWGHG